MARTALFRSVSRTLHSAFADAGLQSNRRQLLGGAAAFGATLALPACVTPHNAASESQGPIVVGGGLAGLSATHFLAKSKLKPRIFEADSRWGGRVQTQSAFNADGMYVELGAEFVDSGHDSVKGLIQELGLELQSLSDETLPSEGYHFEGHWRSETEVLKAFGPLAKKILADTQPFMRDGVFHIPTYRDPLNDQVKIYDAMSLGDYLKICESQVELWVLKLIQVAYTGEYGREVDEQSVVNLFSLISAESQKRFEIFGDSDEAFRIKGGSQTLVDALVGSISKNEGELNSEHVLKAIHRSGSGFQLLFDHKGKVVEVKAEHVVLALPFPLLRRVEGLDGLGLSAVKRNAIEKWTLGTNAKLMLGFADRYWLKESETHAANEGGLLTDKALQAGWDTSRKQDGVRGIFTNFVGGKAGESFTPDRVTATLADLESIYPGIGAQHDQKQALSVWAARPWARGSYTCPAPGHYTSIVGSAGEPELGDRLHFAGEHCSLASNGYMNGAVETGLKAGQMIAARSVPQSSGLLEGLRTHPA